MKTNSLRWLSEGGRGGGNKKVEVQTEFPPSPSRKHGCDWHLRSLSSWYFFGAILGSSGSSECLEAVVGNSRRRYWASLVLIPPHMVSIELHRLLFMDRRLRQPECWQKNLHRRRPRRIANRLKAKQRWLVLKRLAQTFMQRRIYHNWMFLHERKDLKEPEEFSFFFFQRTSCFLLLCFLPSSRQL